jgi:hypothetical protein
MPTTTQTAALLAELDKQPERLVRVIVMLQPGAAAHTEVEAAAKAAGVPSVQPLPGQPMLVVEAKPAQLRRLVATGQVLRLQMDSAAPTN